MNLAGFGCPKVCKKILCLHSPILKVQSTKTSGPLRFLEICKQFGVYLGVKTCEVFLCFVTIMFVLSFVLTSLFSLIYVTREGFYTEDEPQFASKNSLQLIREVCSKIMMFTVCKVFKKTRRT